LLADLTAPIVAVAVLAALSGVGALAARGLPAAVDMARADAAGEPGR